MNWGKGITIAMILFIAFIVTTVVIVVQDDDSLVEDDYYERGINHSQQMEREALGKEVQLDLNEHEVKLKLPVKGTIHYLRLLNMANGEYDREIQVESKLDSVQVINLKTLETGQWQVRAEGVLNSDTFVHTSTKWIR